MGENNEPIAKEDIIEVVIIGPVDESKRKEEMSAKTEDDDLASGTKRSLEINNEPIAKADMGKDEIAESDQKGIPDSYGKSIENGGHDVSINEERHTESIIHPEKDEAESGSGEKKENKKDKVNSNDNSEPMRAKSDEDGIFESSVSEKGNELISDVSVSEDEENNDLHFTNCGFVDDYEDYINEKLEAGTP